MSSSDWATDDEIVLLYPELAFLPPDGLLLATRDFLRECAKCEFDEDVWGCYLKLGHLHFAAFLMECAADAARHALIPGSPHKVGPLASVTEGPQSVSYGGTGTMARPSDQALLAKKSGAQYLFYRDGLGPVPLSLDNIGCDAFGGVW